MSFLTNQLPGLAAFTGSEDIPLDTNLASGAQPQQSKISLYKLALLLTTMLNTLNKTMVAGTIYYTSIVIGDTLTEPPAVAAQSQQSFVLNGVNIPVGTTGGTDTWNVGLYNSSGVLVAQGVLAGVIAGTASTVQQIPFYGSAGIGSAASPVTVPSGTYLIALQSSGTTATFKAVNSPIWPGVTGSQTGISGTLAAIAAVATTYTADLGPAASLY